MSKFRSRPTRHGQPGVVVIAGPNGAGKTTAAGVLLPRTLQYDEFVNADIIAQGLSGSEPEKAALEAGRIMLSRLRELAARRASFAFETTLASRSFAPWLRKLIDEGYAFGLVFFWLPSADMAVERVVTRVAAGGHSVPEETVRRRYERGLRNFFHLYQPLAELWRMYDNTDGPAKLIAEGSGRTLRRVCLPQAWERIARQYGD